MAKIARFYQKIFAASASNNGVFGSAQVGTKVLSNDPATLMGLAAFQNGWNDATISGQRLPTLEEMQALNYLGTTQLAYILQEGIAEYDATTVYYTNSLVKLAGTSQIWRSLQDTQSGHTPAAGSAYWTLCVDYAASRIKLTANTTYYVATTGSNANAGTVGAPWLTLQYAADYIKANIDTNGYTVTISVADGTYGAGVTVTGPVFGGGVLQFQGNTTTPANCLLSLASGIGFLAVLGAQIYVKGFKIVTTSTGTYHIQCNRSSYVEVNGLMDFGAVANGAAHMLCNDSGMIQATANYNITGGAAAHWLTFNGGTIECRARTITITGTPAFATAFAYAWNVSNMLVDANTFSGSATGVRYNAQSNACINTQGGGATYLPGNSAGSTSTGGQYV